MFLGGKWPNLMVIVIVVPTKALLFGGCSPFSDKALLAFCSIPKTSWIFAMHGSKFPATAEPQPFCWNETVCCDSYLVTFQCFLAAGDMGCSTSILGEWEGHFSSGYRTIYNYIYIGQLYVYDFQNIPKWMVQTVPTVCGSTPSLTQTHVIPKRVLLMKSWWCEY